MTGTGLTHALPTALKAVGYAHALGKDGRAKARAEIRAAEAVIQAARDAASPNANRLNQGIYKQRILDALASLGDGQ